MTTHNGPAHTARRQTLQSFATYDGSGRAFVGADGTPLDVILRDSYRSEASRLIDDLGEVLANLPAEDAGHVVGMFVQTVTASLPTEVTAALAELERRMDPATWTENRPGVAAQAADGPVYDPSAPAAPAWTYDGATGGAVAPDGFPAPTDPQAAAEPGLEGPDVVPDTSSALADYLSSTQDVEAAEARPQTKRARARTRAAGKAAADG